MGVHPEDWGCYEEEDSGKAPLLISCFESHIEVELHWINSMTCHLLNILKIQVSLSWQHPIYNNMKQAKKKGASSMQLKRNLNNIGPRSNQLISQLLLKEAGKSVLASKMAGLDN